MRRPVLAFVILVAPLAAAPPPALGGGDCAPLDGPAARSSTRTHGTWAPGPTGPSARATPLVYDEARRRSVLFGGGDFGLPANDTWFLDATGWNPGPPPSGAPARFLHAVVYDSRRQRVVVHGGDWQSCTVPASDTWELDGSGWAPGPAAPFGCRNSPGIAFDSGRGVVVLFGGGDGSLAYGDTWEYDGTSWTPSAATGPLHRFAQAMAYDPGRGVTVMVGGKSDPAQYLRDTWEYDGTTWSRGVDLPYDIAAGAMTYVPPEAAVALVGGTSGYCGASSMLSFYDGTSWTFAQDLPASGRYLHGVAYDRSRNRIVVFGGIDLASRTLADTWEYLLCDIVVSPAALPPGSLGMPYSVQLTATGGTPPHSFALSSGSLPPGLTLSSSGLVAGTPTAQGRFAFEVTVTAGCWVLQAYTIDVVKPSGIAAGQGHGLPNPNRVRLFTATGAPTPFDLYPYLAGSWGANVACGLVDAGSVADTLTGPGPGPALGPQVKAYRSDTTPIAKVNFYAYGTLRYGVNVAAADVVAGGAGEILTGAGPGDVFGPHVRGFAFDASAVQPVPGLSFFAYGTLKYGVSPGGGDVDAAGNDEILTGPGAGPPFGPHVRGLLYASGVVTAMAKVSFFAGSTVAYGALVGGGDVDADGFAEIATTPGPDPAGPSRFLGYDYDGTSIRWIPGFNVTPFPTLYGGRVALADTEGSVRDELLAAPGPTPAATADVRVYGFAGFGLTPLQSFAAFGAAYGATVAGGPLAP